MKFRINDYVRVKAGVLLEETDEPIPGWVGRVMEVNDDGYILIELDAFSLRQLPSRYLQECIEVAESPIGYYLHQDDLEPAHRRDTPQELAAAQANIEDLVFGADEDAELEDAALQQWILAFLASPEYAALPADTQEDAENIISTFGDFGFNYGYVQPPDWTAATVREILVEVLPRKVSADQAYFDHIGPVLTAFFGFLAAQQLHPQAAALQKAVRQHTPALLKNAANPAFWGMAKSMMQQALKEGLNPEEPGAIERYIANYNASLDQQPSGKPKAARPARENPYKHLSRNQPVRVRYTDGSIKEGKFKRLEADLLAGKCTLVQEPPFA